MVVAWPICTVLADCERKVPIIVTGGRFIMAPTSNGLVVEPDYLRKRMEHRRHLIQSFVTDNDWIKLAKDITWYRFIFKFENSINLVY